MGQGEAGFVVLSLLSDLPVSSWAPHGQVRSLPAPCQGSGSGASGSRGGERCDRVPGGCCFQPADGAGSRSTPLPATGPSFHSPLWVSTLLNYGFGVSFFACGGRSGVLCHVRESTIHHSPPQEVRATAPSRLVLPGRLPPRRSSPQILRWLGPGHGQRDPSAPPAFTVRSPRRTRCGGGDGGRGSGSLRCGAR